MARRKKKVPSAFMTSVRNFDYDRNIALGSGIAISFMSAWYSIVGLAAIFPGAALSVYLMGSALELGKIVTASYLYRNWKKLSFLFKAYFTIAVIILMTITSMGTFGYLSKAHIEHTSMSGTTAERVERINNNIETQRQRIERNQTNLNQLDAAVDTMIANDRASRGLAARQSQEAERERIQADITAAENRIDQLMEQRAPFEQEIRRVETEVGPIRYVAEVLYGQSNPDLLERAVRWMIILLVVVFDPLAVLLIMTSTSNRDKPIIHPDSSKYEREANEWLGKKPKIKRGNAVATDGSKWTNIDVDVVRNPEAPEPDVSFKPVR